MKFQSVAKTYLYFILAIVISSCATTERFATYSKTSIGGLKISDEIKYSFRGYCISKSNVLQNTKIISGESISLDSSDCSHSKLTDFQRSKIYTILLSYFDGLQNLSVGQKTDYSVEGITSTFKSGNYTGIDITEDQIKSINSIGSSLISASTGAYRNEKIKQFITESDKPISSVLNLYSGYYELLKTQLDSEKQLYKIYYTEIVKDKSGRFSVSDKISALHDYNASFEKFEKDHAQIELMIKTLKEIKDGHNQLAANVNKLSKSDLKSLLMKSSSNVFQLINEFKSL